MILKICTSLCFVLYLGQGFSQEKTVESDTLTPIVDAPRIFTLDEPLFERSEEVSISCVRMYNRWGEILFETENDYVVPEDYLKYDQLNFGEFYIFEIVGTDKQGEEVKYTTALQFYGYSSCG